jgi:hypothetical protein
VKLYKTNNGILIESKEGLFEAEIHDWMLSSTMTTCYKKLIPVIRNVVKTI